MSTTTGDRDPAAFPSPSESSIARDAKLDGPAAERRARARTIDWFDLLLLAAFAALSMWVLVVNLYYAHSHGLVWTGVDGKLPGDQLTYLAWTRDASRHVLVSDLFVPWPTPHDYLQPMVAISGGLVALGMAPWLALLLWKPIAVAALFFAVRAYCRRMLAGRWERRVALILALCGAGVYYVVGDQWLPFLSWGYPYNLMAVAALAGGLLAYDRARQSNRLPWLAAALGLLACWLNPWEGEVLLLLVLGGELLALGQGREWGPRRLSLPALMIVATALPLVYYAALSHLDREWRLGHGAIMQGWSLPWLLRPLVPMLAASALAYLRRPRSFLSAVTMVWPLATLAAWALNQTPFGGWSSRSWSGITIPLGVLAVQGARNIGFGRLRARWALGGLAVCAVTIPAAVRMMGGVSPPASHDVNLISSSQDRALRYLASDRTSGAVLTDRRLGIVVPAATGRRTYAARSWFWAQPGELDRASAAQRLLDGPSSWAPSQLGPPGAPMSDGDAQHFVLSTGVRFVIQDCGSRANLRRSLAAITRAMHRFGCATVFEVA